MHFPRSSGILLHLTSLPGRFGVGDLGVGATKFLDFLEQAGQSIWQILPLGPPAKGDSPYSCYSAFAGNPLLISIEALAEIGLISQAELKRTDGAAGSTSYADFPAARQQKLPLLAAARANFDSCKLDLSDAFDAFLHASQTWLADFGLFTALADHFSETDWTNWDEAIAQRRGPALDHWRDKLREEIQQVEFTQFLFRQQYDALKVAANQRGIRLFGDMPIFVAHESADVWANQEIFCLDESGKPTVVAGVPPDYFSETGQLWGNPLYDWERLRESNYDWWVERFRGAFRDFDILRLDHFRGFEAYWEIPAGAETAVSGRWAPGPRDELFTSVANQLGELPIIAEDLGLITDEVHGLRDRLGFPGMRVMQFGFDVEHDVFHRPDHFPQHSVAYTGTHDNDTIMGWYAERNGDSDPILSRFLSPERGETHWQLVQLVLESDADIAVIPLQDLLGKDSRSRMNVPGQAEGNWTWRCHNEDMSSTVATQLRALTDESCRTGTLAPLLK